MTKKKYITCIINGRATETLPNKLISHMDSEKEVN